MKEIIIGSTVSFGGYVWRVLAIKDHAALIMTENMIGQHPYHDRAGAVTWADCALRRYLNHDFYAQFSSEEQAKIIPVWNKNEGNQWYGSFGGEDTRDFIFLLSMEEAICKYFGDSSKNLENRSARQRSGSVSWYWRSTARRRGCPGASPWRDAIASTIRFFAIQSTRSNASCGSSDRSVTSSDHAESTSGSSPPSGSWSSVADHS